MGLDRENGELLVSQKKGNLGPQYRVVPVAKWLDLPYWEAAHQEAISVFARTAADERMKQKRAIFPPARLSPDSVVVQEYPTQGRLVFIFQARIGVKDMHHPVVISLSPEDITQLVLMGRWKRELVH